MHSETLKLIIVTCVGYWSFAQLASIFAIPPGFASPVWPAAGFAFLMALRFGRICVVGVFFASTLFNITIAQESILPVSPVWFTAAVIAFGSTLQVVCAYYLVHRFTEFSQVIRNGPDAILMGLLGGPLACLVSSSVGVFSLYLSGVIPYADVFKHWLHWWVGDSIGVMVFAPIVLALNIAQKHAVKKTLILFFSFYLFLVCVATGIFLFAKQQEHTSNRNVFEEQSKGYYEAIHHQLVASTHIVQGVSAIFETFSDVSFDHFQRYTSKLHAQMPGTQALSWIPLVSLSNRKTIESKLLAFGGEKERIFEFTEEGLVVPVIDKNQYFPVLYIFPLQGNHKAVGFDLSSNASRKKALDIVVSSGDLVVTEPITLVQETARQKAFLLFSPAVSQHEGVFGVASGVFRVEDLVRSALGESILTDYVVEIDDITEGAAQNLLSSSSEVSSLYQFQHAFRFGQREWRISISPSHHLALQYQSWWVWFILICSFFLVTLMGLFLLLLIGRTAAVEYEVSAKTLALTHALSQSQSLSQVKSAFLASMSHELRTPLNSIIGFSARLQKGLHDKVDARYLGAIETIHRNGEHLLSLINDLLDLSKVEAGKMAVHKAMFSVDSAINHVLTTLTPLAERKSIELSADASPASVLFADRQRFIQILTNLIGNAIKFTDQGSVHVLVRLKSIGEQSGVEFEIKDSGSGISKEDLPKLFRRYEQLGDTFQGGQMGTGLGLALVQELVHLQGGTVSVRSKLGEGSSFFVWLPSV